MAESAAAAAAGMCQGAKNAKLKDPLPCLCHLSLSAEWSGSSGGRGHGGKGEAVNSLWQSPVWTGLACGTLW